MTEKICQNCGAKMQYDSIKEIYVCMLCGNSFGDKGDNELAKEYIG